MALLRLVVLTVGCLASAWYFMSGGEDFQPGQNGVTVFVASPDQVNSETLIHQAAAVVSQPQAGQQDFTRAVGSEALTSVAVADGASQLDAENKERLAALFEQEQNGASAQAVSFQTVSPQKTSEVLGSGKYRVVTGSRVNMRRGPGTDHDVVGSLLRGAEVEVLDENETGWVKLRTLEGSNIGWMSGKFLTANN